MHALRAQRLQRCIVRAQARLLLDHGADVHAATNYHDTALHMAEREGHADVAELLRRHGASDEATNRFGKTPLAAVRLCGDYGSSGAPLIAFPGGDRGQRGEHHRASDDSREASSGRHAKRRRDA